MFPDPLVLSWANTWFLIHTTISMVLEDTMLALHSLLSLPSTLATCHSWKAWSLPVSAGNLICVKSAAFFSAWSTVSMKWSI